MKLNIKPILGFQGSPDIRLAVLRGEVDIASAEFSSFAAQYNAGELKMLFHGGDKPETVAPGIPSIVDLGYEKEFAGRLTVARTIVGPPDIPKDRAEILQKAIWEALNDPEFVKICEKSERLRLDLKDGKGARESCVSNIKFWTKYIAEIKEEMKRLGYR
jgi:tripartite-type tricarboxylate transporter receptor subunit TctC